MTPDDVQPRQTVQQLRDLLTKAPPGEEITLPWTADPCGRGAAIEIRRWR